MIKKLRHAVEERDEQVAAFLKFNAALPIDITREWLRMIEAWEQDSAAPNPFMTEHESAFICI